MTILGAISLRGMIATMTIEAATDAEIFLAYVEHVSCPALKPGNVVGMDNLSCHKVSGVRERIEKADAEILYLPPHSPDLNPIEKAWAKLKQLLRSAKARTKEVFDQAIEEAIKLISPDNAKHGSDTACRVYSKTGNALMRVARFISRFDERPGILASVEITSNFLSFGSPCIQLNLLVKADSSAFVTYRLGTCPATLLNIAVKLQAVSEPSTSAISAKGRLSTNIGIAAKARIWSLHS